MSLLTKQECIIKAIVYTQYGSPDVLQLKEVPKPVPKANEVLIKIHATTVNRTDCGFLSGKPFIVRFFAGLTKPKIQILGNEFAGEIESIGSSVTRFAVGDRVFGHSGEVFGCHAEYMTFAEDGPIATIPGNRTYIQSASSTEGIHYAYNDIRTANVRSGQKVIVNGATGAIGSAAVQIIKYLGAHVTAVCNTKNVELVRSLGADVVIDYMKEDFTKIDGEFDFIFDSVGKSSFGACKHLLKPGGIYCSTEFGPRTENPFLAIWTSFFGDKKVIFPLPKIDQKDTNFFRELIASGKLNPVIDRTYPLEQVADAYRYVETGEKTGNVIISISQ